MTDEVTEFNRYHFEESGSIIFALDERSTFKSGSVNYVQIDSIEYYSFLNVPDNSFNLYKVSSKEIFKKIKLDLEGPNGVGRLVLVQHLLVNLDSIFIYNINQGTLYLVDFEGRVKDRFVVFDFKNDNGNAFPVPSNPSPLIRAGNKIFISCDLHARQNDYTSYKNILCYDFVTKEIKYISPLPEIYSKAFWGSTFKFIPSLCIDGQKTELVVSYPIDFNIYKFDFEGKLRAKKAVKSVFFSKMEPMKEDITFGTKNDINVFDEEQKLYSLSNSDFAFIKYDPYNKLYYRGSYLRPIADSVKTGKRIPDFSIIILNEQFEKLGETKFDKDNFDLTMHFVGRDGYYIARPDLYKLNEDEIVFTKFKVMRNR